MSRPVGSYIQNQLVYFKNTNKKSWFDAVGPNVVKFIDDFTHIPVDDTTGDPTAWSMTVVEAGSGNTTVTSGNISGGAMLITTDNADNDGANLQLNGESFKLASGVPVYFGTRFKINDATQSDFFIGLAITDTDILGGVTDRIGFESLDGSNAVAFLLEKDSTETNAAAVTTLTDDTFVELEFHYDGASRVEAFVNGTSVSVPALTNLPNDEELRVTVQFLAGAAAIKTMTVDWIRVIQLGRAA